MKRFLEGFPREKPEEPIHGEADLEEKHVLPAYLWPRVARKEVGEAEKCREATDEKPIVSMAGGKERKR